MATFCGIWASSSRPALALALTLTLLRTVAPHFGHYDPPNGYEGGSPPDSFGLPTLPPFDRDEPPPEYDSRDASPPPVFLDIRLVDSRGIAASGLQQGIVQLYSEQLSNWGAICIDPGAALDNKDAYRNIAKLICRQLGLPQRYATIIPASLLTQGSVPTMPFVAITNSTVKPCDNAATAGTVMDCEGLLLQPTILPCNLVDAGSGGSAEPAAVICSGTLPPPPSRPPPYPSWVAPLHLTTRLLDPITGETYPELFQGRLQVLLPGADPEDTNSWGTVCSADSQLSRAVAQYACLQAGKTGWEAGVFYQPFAQLPLPGKVPVALVTARDCTVERNTVSEPRLYCSILAGQEFNPELFLPEGGLSQPTQGELLQLRHDCDSGNGLDVFVQCPALIIEPMWPSGAPPFEPTWPSVPPAIEEPQMAYNHGVVVVADQVLPNVYELTFVALRGGEHIAGTVCSRNDDINSYVSWATRMTLCNNISFGAQPYGFIAPAPLSVNIPFLDPAKERRAKPVLLRSFECKDGFGNDDEDPLPDLSYCAAEFAKPFGRALYDKCWYSGWASSLLVCTDQYFNHDPEVVSARLEGGPYPWIGRLEVLMRDDLHRGWGTVCDDGSFNLAHAQAVCRDLGFNAAAAQVLNTSFAIPVTPPRPVLMMGLDCQTNVFVHGKRGKGHDLRLSFIRDCVRSPKFVPGDCPPDQHVLVSCGAPDIATMPPPSPSPPPYGGNYGSYPPLPPSYTPPTYNLPPPAPPPRSCSYGGYYGDCHGDDHPGGKGGYGGYGHYGR